MMNSGEGQFAFWLAIGAIGVAFWVAMYPLIAALAKRISGGGAAEDRMSQLEARLAAVEARSLGTGEVDAQDARMAELEERLEFAERLLAQGREVPRLSGER